MNDNRGPIPAVACDEFIEATAPCLRLLIHGIVTTKDFQCDCMDRKEFEVMPIPGVGDYVSFFDTEGNRVSMLQPNAM